MTLETDPIPKTLLPLGVGFGIAGGTPDINLNRFYWQAGTLNQAAGVVSTVINFPAQFPNGTMIVLPTIESSTGVAFLQAAGVNTVGFTMNAFGVGGAAPANAYTVGWLALGW